MTYSLSDAVKPLLEPEQFHTVGEIQNNPSIVPPAPGIYGWWFGSCLETVPRDGTREREGRRLLYVGIAPQSAVRAQGRKSRTLRDRIKNHCRGPISSSTLRRTLAALLVQELDLEFALTPSGKLRMRPSDEDRLSDWMDLHARVAWMCHEAPWLLEDELIAKGPRLPLNIRGSSDAFRLELKKLRSAMRNLDS